MCLVTESAMAIFDWPMVNDALRSSWPYRPPPRFLPYTLAFTVTLVPGGQYSLGRQCTSRSSNQYQAPSTFGVVVTERVFSAAARSFTSSSNHTTMGWPTPKVPPLSRVPTFARR